MFGSSSSARSQSCLRKPRPFAQSLAFPREPRRAPTFRSAPLWENRI